MRCALRDMRGTNAIVALRAWLNAMWTRWALRLSRTFAGSANRSELRRAAGSTGLERSQPRVVTGAGKRMSIQVETKDCTALGDAELAELADLCAEGPIPHEVGVLSKQAEAWVLITQARENDKLKGFAFSTLERIGGTPSVLVGKVGR